MTQQSVVRIRDLTCQLSTEFAVQIGQLYLGPGDIVVMDAASGAGKSTVLGMIIGALESITGENGRHWICGQDMALRPGHALGPDMLGFVLQTNALIPYLTVEANIILPLQLASQKTDSEWYRHLIGALGLEALLKRKPHEISVGQRQRAAIARALSGQPALLLLDEPVSALDPANAGQVEHLIAVLAEDSGSAVVLASHQAARGAFARAPRLTHQLLHSHGQAISRFSMPPATLQNGARVFA